MSFLEVACTKTKTTLPCALTQGTQFQSRYCKQYKGGYKHAVDLISNTDGWIQGNPLAYIDNSHIWLHKPSVDKILSGDCSTEIFFAFDRIACAQKLYLVF